MILDAKFLILHSAKIIYTLLPKCASTTMHKVFLDAGGIQTSLEPRQAVWGDDLAVERRQAGLEGSVIPDSELEAFTDKHKDYFWFSVVRDPYARCLSGYNQQIRRYAGKYDRLALFKGQIAPLLINPLQRNRPKRRTIVTNKLKQEISFDRFLDGIRRHGVGFDRHFALQSDVLKFDRVKYDCIVDLHDLENGLNKIFGGGRGERFDVPKMNPSSALKAPNELLTVEAKAKIHAIYRQDFENFGFAR